MPVNLQKRLVLLRANMNGMSTERFHLVYDGPALAEHRMDVRDLAPALIAIGNLATDANRLLNGESTDVRVEVHASFKAGSFGIEMFFSQDILKQVSDLLTGQAGTALANLGGIISLTRLTGAGLIALLRNLKGRKPQKIEELTEGAARLWMSETEIVTVEDSRILKLYRDKAVRMSLNKLLSPLEREGIESFGVVKDEQVVLLIEKHEHPYFQWQSDEEIDIVSDTTRERILLMIESVVFKDGNKWRVHDGQTGFHAAICDDEFIARIEHGERFGKGDVLTADVRITQTISNGTLQSQYEIIRVHEHREPLQRPLL